MREEGHWLHRVKFLRALRLLGPAGVLTTISKQTKALGAQDPTMKACSEVALELNKGLEAQPYP